MFHYFLLNLDSIYFYFIILRFPFYSAFIYISRKDKKIICLHKFNMMPLSIRQKRFVFVFVFTLPSVLYLGSFPRTRSSHAMCVTRIHCGPQKRILNAVVWKYWSLLWSSPQTSVKHCPQVKGLFQQVHLKSVTGFGLVFADTNWNPL